MYEGKQLFFIKVANSQDFSECVILTGSKMLHLDFNALFSLISHSDDFILQVQALSAVSCFATPHMDLQLWIIVPEEYFYLSV